MTKWMIRPWGRMRLLFKVKHAWAKIIEVSEGQSTSKQYHRDRWELHVGLDRWYWKWVPAYRIHRLGGGRYFELAWGYPAEEDIVRLGDMYGRK